MQRVLIALYLAAASAFAPQQLTQNSLAKLQANPIDIYSNAPARNCDFTYSWGAAVLDYFALPIVELPKARTSKIATQRDLTRPRSEANRGPIPHAGAAEDCLQEECSVDTVQMLIGQLKTREQELAKKGRIVDYEREAALAGVRTMIHDLEGPVRRAASFLRREARRRRRDNPRRPTLTR